MRILISAYRCDPKKGGEPGHGYNWAYHNAVFGHSVWCITTPNGRKNIEEELKDDQIKNLSFIYVSVPRWVQKLYRYQFGIYLHYIVWQYCAARAAKKADKDHNFELVHHVTYGSLQMGSSMWKLGKPFLFGPVGGGQFASKEFKKYFYNKWRSEVIRSIVNDLMLIFNPLLTKTIKRADVIFTINDETRQMAKKLGGKNLVMSLDACLPDHFFPSEFPERAAKPILHLVWVARLFARKGLPLVLEALSKVNPSIPFKLTIYGNGDQGPLVPQWIKEYGLEEKVDWKGQVKWEELKQGLLQNDVFFLCSLRDTFGAQYMEAMAYGLPLITLDIHGAKTFIPKEAAIKVQQTTPEETVMKLAEAVEYLYNHPEERVRMGNEGYRFAKKHTWTKQIEFMNEFYQKYADKLN